MGNLSDTFEVNLADENLRPDSNKGLRDRSLSSMLKSPMTNRFYILCLADTSRRVVMMIFTDIDWLREDS